MNAPTPEQRAEWRAYADAATPGPWHAATAPHPDSGETNAEYVTRALVGGTLWTTWAANDTDDDYDYLVPALTGDGPTSEVNARFVAAARTAVPVLLDALDAAEAERDAALTRLDAVRVLHRRGWAGDGPDDGSNGPPSFCHGCSHMAQEWVPWPCPIARALGVEP